VVRKTFRFEPDMVRTVRKPLHLHLERGTVSRTVTLALKKRRAWESGSGRREDDKRKGEGSERGREWEWEGRKVRKYIAAFKIGREVEVRADEVLSFGGCVCEPTVHLIRYEIATLEGRRRRS